MSARPPLFELFLEVAIIHQLATRAFEAVLPPPLTVPQFGVLDHLLRLPGAWSPGRLASAFQVPRPTMTNTLQRLAAAGLVRFESDPDDGRGKHVVATDAGRELRDRAIAALGPALAMLDAQLPPGAAETLLPPLAALRARLDAARDIAPGADSND